ncbi:MAG: YARHG domain-containing protein [Devosia nanyangense]|uniref:YARHG domain-containing protein n=1 Tax=Devosia nanyangense TaxID=1228055 RepID=A0A933L1Y2_9HYPH|nr:YARHG domain-containing protein [Devosia nanyangense]
MKLTRVALIALGLVAALPGTAMAASCFDLWYERNAIYDDNGYCFRTDLALEYFDNDDCWTRHPIFSRAEQRAIDAIVYEEKRRGCHVN